ncbi:hypothetical protein EDB85DRAFT_1566817 [Lactarius pseudohatsudake]|nr:hypothetical protein EDB85DRAFT_1566817 [Lactarius pseudohatsudake]
MDGIVESPEGVSAAAGPKMQRKSWRKALRTNRSGMTKAIAMMMSKATRAKVCTRMQYLCLFLQTLVARNARRHRRHRARSWADVLPSLQTQVALQDALYADQGVDVRAMSQPVLRFIEKWYPELTSDRSAETFECPACCNYGNCSLCSQTRGETVKSYLFMHAHALKCDLKIESTGTTKSAIIIILWLCERQKLDVQYSTLYSITRAIR